VTPGARELREWVEELASRLERDGLPRMAGRIFAWLLVCEPAEQSMEDLAAALQGSKASMSTMTRLLANAGLVERVRRPGARRDVCRVREGSWDAYWQAQMARLRQTTACLARGAGLLAGRPPPTRARIEGVLQQYRFLEGAVPMLAERWKASDAGPARDGAPPGRHENVTSTRRATGGASRRPAARGRRNLRASRT
jgi:hypothetical protein